jgi:hypothetical protein
MLRKDNLKIKELDVIQTYSRNKMPLRSRRRSSAPAELPELQKLILSSAFEMLESNDNLRKSITMILQEFDLFPFFTFSSHRNTVGMSVIPNTIRTGI